MKSHITLRSGIENSINKVNALVVATELLCSLILIEKQKSDFVGHYVGYTISGLLYSLDQTFIMLLDFAQMESTNFLVILSRSTTAAD